MDNQYEMFNRTILAQIYIWIKDHTEKREGHIPEICHRIRTAGYNSAMINQFSEDERLLLREITMTDEFEEIKLVNISMVVMALEVAKLWVNDIPKQLRPHINVSDKKLKMGKNLYTLYMLKCKQEDRKLYDDQKEIIETTANHANTWYNYIKKHTVKED